MERCDVDDAAPYRAVQAYPGADDLARLRELLARAERPLAIVGGGGWTEQASADLLAFVEANGLPTGASFRCQDYLDNRSSCYVGDVGLAINPALAQRVREADLLLALGTRLGESTTSGYTLVEAPRPRQRLVHAHPGVEELGRVYQAELAIVSGLPELCAALRRLEPVDGGRWAGWAADGRADFLAHSSPLPSPGPVNVSEVVALPVASACRTTRSSRTAPATSRSGRTASTGSGATGRNWPRRAGRWATGCRPRSRPGSFTPAGSSSACQATATS